MRNTNSKSCFKHEVAQPSPENFDDFPLPVVDMNLKGVFTHVNKAASQLYHLPAEELIGKTGWDFSIGDQLKVSKDAFQAMLATKGNPPTIRRTFHDQEGGFHTCDFYRSFLYSVEGERTGIRYIFVEVTELQAIAEECKHSLLWHESLLESISEAIVATDVLGFITYVNPAAERLIGWKAHELHGKQLESTLPLIDDATGDVAMLTLEEALERRALAETAILDGEGQQLRVEIHSAPIIDKETGSTSGVISVIRRLDGKW